MDCEYRRVDPELGKWYCRAASSDSLTGTLTITSRHVTCEDCPVPRLLHAHRCLHLELRPIIMPSVLGSVVIDIEAFCQEDGVKLDSPDGCGLSCAAYKAAPMDYVRAISS
jgi:hypothetical protein